MFAGEFAAHEGRPRKNNLRGAISEAAFMAGLVRNSDIVVMSAYAPLLAKAGASQWAPDLIWFDNTPVYGTPSYHVQALFSIHRPDTYVPSKIEGPPVTLPPLPRNAIATYGAEPEEPYRPASVPLLFVAAGRDEDAGEIVIFVANPL
ncbi:MAG: alpha-L-arabinofuranosidase C-terminal domain-containing protein [Opitutaceae bacterium]